MGNSVRRIFSPTKEEEIEDLELYIRIHDNLIGSCSTCAHHTESTVPGFVTDYGECNKKYEKYLDKVVSGPNDIVCPLYEESTEHINNLKRQLESLKKE